MTGYLRLVLIVARQSAFIYKGGCGVRVSRCLKEESNDSNSTRLTLLGWFGDYFSCKAMPTNN